MPRILTAVRLQVHTRSLNEVASETSPQESEVWPVPEGHPRRATHLVSALAIPLHRPAEQEAYLPDDQLPFRDVLDEEED